MLGLDLHSWELVMLWSLGFAALAAFAVVVSTTAVVKLQKAATEETRSEFDRYKLDADKKISEAGARALEAQLELAKFKAPRGLNSAQQQKIISRIKGFSAQAFQGAVAPALADGFSFWGNLAMTLIQATWTFVLPEGLKHGDPPAAIPISVNPGVLIAFAPESPPAVKAAAQELAAALAAEGIAASAAEKPFGEMAKKANMIMVVIGPKPQ